MKGGEALYALLINGVDMFALRWSSAIDNIRVKNPEEPLTVWNDEDIPLVWPELLQAVAYYAPGMVLNNEGDLLATLMPPKAIKWMQAYIDCHPITSTEMRRRIVTTRLDKFALQYKANVETPASTEATVETLTQLYGQDVERIANTPGVRFIAP